MNKIERPSTVGRGKSVKQDLTLSRTEWIGKGVKCNQGNSLDFYQDWDSPQCIISDGGYGILGFEGDTSDHLGLPSWYEPHIAEWSKKATPQTTLWFWNSEIGWASVHPVLEKYGWRYVNANIWDKGKGHIAGNVNTSTIRRFPVTTEICVQYVFGANVKGTPIREWLRSEWDRTGLPLRLANEACGVRDAAVRKYLDKGHLWYFPPKERFQMLQEYANTFGNESGRPYFSIDGINPASGQEWERMRSVFNCPYGVTNVWQRSALRGKERITINGGKSVHLNQKPLDLISMLIESSTERGGVVWEPFGGLFTSMVASLRTERKGFGGELDPVYFKYATDRLESELESIQES